MLKKKPKAQPVFETLGYKNFEEFGSIIQEVLERVVKTSQKLGNKPKKLRQYLQKYSTDKHFRDVSIQAVHTMIIKAAQEEFFARMSLSFALEMIDADPMAPLTDLARDISNELWNRMEQRELAADLLIMFYHYLYQHLTNIAMQAMQAQQQAAKNTTKH